MTNDILFNTASVMVNLLSSLQVVWHVCIEQVGRLLGFWEYFLKVCHLCTYILQGCCCFFVNTGHVYFFTVNSFWPLKLGAGIIIIVVHLEGCYAGYIISFSLITYTE